MEPTTLDLDTVPVATGPAAIKPAETTDGRVATNEEHATADQPGALEHVVRDFIVKTFVFDDAVASGLTNSSDLVEIGLLDSMNVLQLVDFIEVEFDFLLDPEDLFLLTSIDGIVKIIRERTGS